jgi:hypothetical protein
VLLLLLLLPLLPLPPPHHVPGGMLMYPPRLPHTWKHEKRRPRGKDAYLECEYASASSPKTNAIFRSVFRDKSKWMFHLYNADFAKDGISRN